MLSRMGRILRLVQEELDTGSPVSWRDRLRMITAGFLSESYFLYQLDKNDRSQYVTDYQRWIRTPDLTGKYRVLLNDKLLFALVVRNFPAHEIESVGVIRNGRIFCTAGKVGDAAEWLLSLLQSNSKLVIKPVVGGGGGGVRVLVRKDDGPYMNEAPLTVDRLREMMSGPRDQLVSRYVEQCETTSAMYPRTVNTLRILTMWDVEKNEPFIVATALRIGCARSYPVDNWVHGGLSAEVDLTTGRVGMAANHPRRTSALTWYTMHPESDAPIEGVVLPHWDLVKSKVLEISRSLPILPYVGWDLILTADGFKILEGNSFPSVTLHQVHAPLLTDERVVKFYRSNQIL
jgi:hypothetical protein